MFSFFLKQKAAFGLDISGSSLRAMQLRPLGGKFFPQAFCDTPVPKGSIVEDKILGQNKLAALLRDSLRRPRFGRFDSQYVILSVPESRSFVRVITVPKMTEEEAKEAVPFEAEQYIPMSSDQVYLDFKFLPSSVGFPVDKMRVLICATPREVVDSYVGIVRDAGLKTAAVEVESEALARALVNPSKDKEAILILDFSATRANLIIYDQGSLQFTSSLPIGGNTFTGQIAQGYSVSTEEAEKLKRQVGLGSGRDGGKMLQVLNPLLISLVEALRNTMNFYREHSDGSRSINAIMLTGGGSKIKGFADYISQQMSTIMAKSQNLSVRLGDPWVNVLEQPIKKIPPISRADSVSFSTVVGLALRGVEMDKE